mmetsp:Transcript_44789/g.146920  ORF Transcript_44789/g.146920 Transcript_44789/m.146920 type:complete len:223 (-) Transcript_44789:19-687(-)
MVSGGGSADSAGDTAAVNVESGEAAIVGRWERVSCRSSGGAAGPECGPVFGGAAGASWACVAEAARGLSEPLSVPLAVSEGCNALASRSGGPSCSLGCEASTPPPERSGGRGLLPPCHACCRGELGDGPSVVPSHCARIESSQYSMASGMLPKTRRSASRPCASRRCRSFGPMQAMTSCMPCCWHKRRNLHSSAAAVSLMPCTCEKSRTRKAGWRGGREWLR